MEVKKWRCTVCGVIFEGEVPPSPCPVCGAGADAFEQIGVKRAARWKCTVCGQIFEGAAPPVPCPVCGAGADAFVPLEEAGAAAYRRDSGETLVLVGGGGAALAAAKAIRERDKTARVVMVCGEGVLPYNRPALSDVVADGYSFAAVALEPAQWYADNRVELVLDAAAAELLVQQKQLRLSDGRLLRYDKLLLATGANAFCPVTADAGAPPVQVLRGWADAQALLARAVPGARAVVVGGGILGLEAALALYERGAKVQIVELAPRLLSMQADEFAGGVIAEKLAALGIGVAVGVSVAGVAADGVHLADGRVLAADLVLVSAGIRSELTLARAAGLAVGRGVLVDETMAARTPDIYAAGDCAEFNGRIAGSWGAALAMGAAAGAAMTGDAAAYRPAVPATAFAAPGIDFFAAGSVGGERLRTVVLRDETTGVYHKLAFRDGHLVGVLMLGGVRNSAAAVAAVERGDAPDKALSLLA